MSEHDSTVLRVKNLAVDFDLHGGAIHAVKDVSFDIPRGKTVALVGESGSGKSVTAQAVLGILPAIARITAGEVLFSPHRETDAIDLARVDTSSEQYRAIRGGEISMIFQEPMVSLSPLHTVGDQVSEALFLHQNLDQTDGIARTRDMLDLVGFPDPDRALRTYPFELSGGLRQRAMIAMALVCRPALLIADEPTTALDVTIQAQILKLIRDLQAELNMAVLMITHDLGVVANVADEVVVMYHGEIMETGSREEIFNDPQHPYLRALHKAIPHFDMAPGERLTPIREVQVDLSALGDKKQKWSDSALTDPHLRVSSLSKSFTIRSEGWMSSSSTKIRAVDDVSFEIRPGECFGLVGESGCGKTTLSKMLMRALSPDSGEVVYNDRGNAVDVLALEGDELFAFRRKMQFVFQDPFSSLSPRMTVFDIIREPLVIHEVCSAQEQVQRVQELMSVVGLDPRFLNRYPHSFSGGQRQRIGIARALALSPDLLICDEPVSALDVSIQAQILNLLKDLQAEMGLTYLFISHNLAVVDYIADRIAVMCQGHLVEIATKQELFNSPQHPYTQALLKAVPFPDLAKPLDFDAVAENAYSNPALWPAPYTLSPADPGRFIDVGASHHVRVSETHAS